MSDICNMPWEEDEIEFLHGDWSIRRAECVGLYTYTFCGVEGQNEVDAVQLIEWHMAQVIEYPLFLPWPNSDLTFCPDDETELMRDVCDTTSKVGNRDYLMLKKGKLYRVNRFYLHQQKLAVGGSEFQKEVAKAKVSVPKALTGVAWDSDGIVIFSKAGLKITRGYSEGKYRVVSDDGMYFRNCNAAGLVADGLARWLADLQLEKLAKKSDTTMKAVRASTHGFWNCKKPDSVKTFRDIARLHYNMLKGNAENIAELLTSFERMSSNIGQVERDINEKLSLFDAKKKEFDRAFEKSREKYQKLFKKPAVGVLTDVDEAANEFAALADLVTQANTVYGEMSFAFTSAQAACDADGEFLNIKIYPDDVREVIEAARKKLPDIKEALKGARAKVERKTNDFQAAAAKKAELDKMTAFVASGLDKIQDVRCRRAELEEIVKLLDADASVKKSFHFGEKTLAGDKIVFITKLKIELDEAESRYVFTYDGGGKTARVSGDELVYMKLAKAK